MREDSCWSDRMQAADIIILHIPLTFDIAILHKVYAF